jgi:hypothetical protein
MAEKHTPGPWTVNYDPVEISKRIICIDAEDDPSLAQIHACDRGAGEVLVEQDWANARLIASAPELLEALEAITTAIELSPVPEAWGDALVSAVQQARAAIAKARGGTVT